MLLQTKILIRKHPVPLHLHPIYLAGFQNQTIQVHNNKHNEAYLVVQVK